MGFSYDPLWKLMIDKKITKKQLQEKLKTSPSTIAKMGKGENVSLDVIDRICNTLECTVEDVIKHVPDQEL
ncbi:transcriptional regulator [Bacillus sp. AFS015802]|uniref:helix-turn-helix domain-containing protein n=1 Tax=Bacillus sp. AFS015802 TaxID=2033486 RepID=UPI000BF52D81|nr:helix-turn-helix transcriptional regulator [Bacillus sp. AFS015802]PFA66864.1 transcriptional regulator [Bacillus sp. AFS015802]